MTEEPIQEIEHTADWAIRVRGQNLQELFVNAARGMFGLIADLDKVESAVTRQVALDAYDVETLLVSWLSELLWINEESDLVFAEYELQTLTPAHLEARVRGGPAPDQRKHIKAVTFHDLEIVQKEHGLEVTLVFDV
jgi:SHS2 domain-containing protein